MFREAEPNESLRLGSRLVLYESLVCILFEFRKFGVLHHGDLLNLEFEFLLDELMFR